MKLEKLFLPVLFGVLVLSSFAVFVSGHDVEATGSAEIGLSPGLQGVGGPLPGNLREQAGQIRGELRETRNEGRQVLVAKRERLVEAWRDLRNAKVLTDEERNVRLLTAIQVFADVSIELGEKAEAKGYDAAKVQEFVSVTRSLNESAFTTNSSFSQRKEIFRKLHALRRDFLRDVSKVLIVRRVKDNVIKLDATLDRTTAAIDALAAKNITTEQLSVLREAQAKAENATASVLMEPNLKRMVRKLLRARASVKHVIRLIIRVQNYQAIDGLKVEEVPEAATQSVPDVELNVTKAANATAV